MYFCFNIGSIFNIFKHFYFQTPNGNLFYNERSGGVTSDSVKRRGYHIPCFGLLENR